MWLVVGLGNPGGEYEKTRHNVGWMVLDTLLSRDTWEENKSIGAFLETIGSGKSKMLLVKPTTMMNRSGLAVLKLVKDQKIKPEQVILVHDDLDMELGKLRILFGRGSGGHHGVESVSKALKTNDYTRIKVGLLPTTPGGKLKKPKGDGKIQKFILGEFDTKEKTKLKKTLHEAADAIETIVTEGRTRAMNTFN